MTVVRYDAEGATAPVAGATVGGVVTRRRTVMRR